MNTFIKYFNCLEQTFHYQFDFFLVKDGLYLQLMKKLINFDSITLMIRFYYTKKVSQFIS